MTSLDVVIVGGRCAGAGLARLLAQGGMSVAVVDRSARGTDTTSTHALMRGGVAQLARWGLLDRIIEAGTPAIRKTTFWYGTTPLAIPITPKDGVDALYSPRRTLLDSVLRDAAEAAGVRLCEEHRATALVRHRDGRVAGVEVIDATGHTETIRANLVVGADGLRSTVAQWVEAPIVTQYTHATATLYGYFDGLPVDGSQWYFGDGIAAGAIPTNDGRTGVFVSVPPSRFAARFQGRQLAGFVEGLNEMAPDFAATLGASVPVERFRGFGGHPGQVRQRVGPGWALVGDAAAFRDPITAHGITDALRDAGLLAETILDGSVDAWRDYPERCRLASTPVFDLSDRIASFDWTLEEVQALHQDLSRAMNHAAKASLARPPRVLAS